MNNNGTLVLEAIDTGGLGSIEGSWPDKQKGGGAGGEAGLRHKPPHETGSADDQHPAGLVDSAGYRDGWRRSHDDGFQQGRAVCLFGLYIKNIND